MNMPKVSVITVVWNDVKGLERTIQSVIEQTYENVEFIIIDGGSTDGTVDVIKKYEEHIDYWISEKDNGIYDAMNKGISLATGVWVNFMNAGDKFVDQNVLSNIDFNDLSKYVLIYGNKIYRKKIVYPLEIIKLEVGEIHANHQSMFFNKDKLGSDLHYDLTYKIYGDYELVNKIYLNYKTSIKYINLVIADFEGGGISSFISTQKRKDKYRIVYKYYGLLGIFKSILSRLAKANK